MIAGLVVQPWSWILAIPVHAVAWYLLVAVGHRRYEHHLDVGGDSQDSNVYFRERWFVLRGLGADRASALIQLGIAPLHAAYDLLLAKRRPITPVV